MGRGRDLLRLSITKGLLHGNSPFVYPFFPEQPAAGLEEQPRIDALAAELEVHGQVFAQCANGLPAFHALALAHRESIQPVEVAAHPAAVVDDDGVAGEVEVPGQHHDAVGRGAAGVARDGVEFRGVRSAALLAVGDFGLAEVHQSHVILRRAGKAAAPQLFAGGLLIEGPDGVAELGVGSFGGFRFGFDFNRAEVLRDDGDVLHHRLAAHSKGHFMRTGSGIVSRRDIGAPPAAQTDSLHIAEVCFHRRGRLTHHAGKGCGHRAALLHPFGGKLHLGACLQRKAEGVIIPTDGLRGLFEPDVLPQLAGAAALELGGQHIFRQTPDGQLGLIVAVGREQKSS